MIAKIKDINNEIYCTNVLAMKYDGWNSKAIVFDKNRKHIVCLYIWIPCRKFFNVDSEKNNWIKQGKWEGFDWLVSDKNAMKTLVGGFLSKGRKLAVGDLMVSLPLTEEPNVPEWNDLKTKQNIESLLDVSMNFHDAAIESIEKTETSLMVDFDTTWGCRIILKCSEVVEFNFDNLGIILDSTLEIKDGEIYWHVVDGYSDDWNSGADSNNWFLKSKKIEWKLIITENKH